MKKGFTLLELLAVIVVLAIIALIVTPFVTNAIKEARIGSAENSTYGIISAAELYYAETLSKNGGTFNPLTATFSSGTMSPNAFTFKGDKPKGGSLTIDENGVVAATLLTFGNYECSGGSKTKVVCYPEGTTPKPKEYNTGDAIYFNPVANTKCSEGEDRCMKWYAIENSDNTKNTVDVILDHNTSNGIKWNSSGSNLEMKEVAAKLAEDTSTWHESVKDTARLIKANEVADIVGARGEVSTKAEKFDVATTTYDKWFYFDGADGTDTKWQTQVAKSKGASKYAWLYSNLYECEQYGCDKQTTISRGNYGYWTQDVVSGVSIYVWGVSYNGRLNYGNVGYSGYGVRPVITIPKSVLK